jgi:diphthine methyl ester synthase
MLYFIGLGLADIDDLTVKGLRIIQNCRDVYLETYTTILQIDQKTIEEKLGIQVIPADRELVELSAGILTVTNRDRHSVWHWFQIRF